MIQGLPQPLPYNLRDMKVGQAGSLRGGWLPPPSAANAAVGRLPNRPQPTRLPRRNRRLCRNAESGHRPRRGRLRGRVGNLTRRRLVLRKSFGVLNIRSDYRPRELAGAAPLIPPSLDLIVMRLHFAAAPSPATGKQNPICASGFACTLPFNLRKASTITVVDSSRPNCRSVELLTPRHFR